MSPLVNSSSLTHEHRLSVSSVVTKEAIAGCGFAMSAPLEWNRLPLIVGSQQVNSPFKIQLKTYLIRLAHRHHSHPSMVGVFWVMTSAAWFLTDRVSMS